MHHEGPPCSHVAVRPCPRRRGRRSRRCRRTTSADASRAGFWRKRPGAVHDFLVGGQRPQRDRRLQLAGQLLFDLHARDSPKLDERRDAGHRQWSRERHLFLARPGGERGVRPGGVVAGTELQRHGRGRRRAGHAHPGTDQGILDIPPAGGHHLQLDRCSGRRDLRSPGLEGPELPGAHADPVRQHSQYHLLVRHRSRRRRQLLGARVRRERERHRQRAVEPHHLLRFLQQPPAAAAVAGVSRQWHDGDAAGHAHVDGSPQSAAEWV